MRKEEEVIIISSFHFFL